MHNFLKDQIERPGPDGKSLLNIIPWNGEYNHGMKKLGVKAAQLQPQLIDGPETKLLKEHFQPTVKTTKEWMNKIMEDDTKDFILPTHQPKEEDSKKEHAQWPTMFTMINQQLSIALGSNKGNVVTGVVYECIPSRLLKNRQVPWQEVTADEIHKHFNATTKEDLEDLLNVPNRPGRPTGPGGDCSPGRPGQLNSGRRLTASIIREDGRPRG